MKVEFSPAYILHQRYFRETSRILDVITPQHGRISVVAKGTNNKRSQQGLYQIYQPLYISWQGQGELYTLTSIEAASAPYLLIGDASLCGLYINELLVRLFPQNLAEPDLFSAYQEVLSRLALGDNSQQALRVFEKELLTVIGYGLVLDQQAETGQEISDNDDYFYQPDAGLFPWTTDSPYPRISGRSLRHLMNGSEFDQNSLNEIKKMMRSVIHFYLGGKALRSRELFSQMHAAQHKG